MKTELYSLVAGFALLCAPVALKAQAGDLDLSFNGTGYVIHPVNTVDAGQKILVQPDQKVLLIGMSFDANSTARAYVFRYMPDGTPDVGFGTNGIFTYELDNEADIYSAVLTPEGKILLAGATTDYQTYRLLLIQLNADGTLDNSFGINGVLAQSISVVAANAEDMAYDVALDGVGNIVVCGSTFDTSYVRRPFVARFSANGVYDTSFGVNGIASIPVLAVGSSSFEGVVVQPDGKIVASGYFGNTELWYVMLLVRFNADGSLDPTFGDAGVVKYNYGNFDFASNVELLSDGSIVMAGSSGVGPPGSFDQVVWKYHADGTPDATFGTNGYSELPITGYYTMINAMAVQEDGKILVGGQARTTVNQNYFYVARIQNALGTGVAELNSMAGTRLFPDPAMANSMVTLQVPNADQPDARISLYAADGRLVHTAQATGPQRDAEHISFQLPADLAPGSYQLAYCRPGYRHTFNLLVTH